MLFIFEAPTGVLKVFSAWAGRFFGRSIVGMYHSLIQCAIAFENSFHSQSAVTFEAAELNSLDLCDWCQWRCVHDFYVASSLQ